MLKEKVNSNSIENQSIKSDFVNREVYCCASSLIYQLQQDGHYTDEIMEFSLKDELREEDLKDEIREYYKKELKENNIKLNYRLLNNEVMQVNNIKYQRGGF